ncbi:hypothetical protein ACSBR1_003183 [Camellia fascicularis]
MEANEFELCKRHLLINFSVTEQEVVLGAMYVHIDFINSNPVSLASLRLLYCIRVL